MIQDSGDRTEFTTGAVRDMHEGKGRLDLLPFLAVLELAKHCEEGAKKYGEHNVDKYIRESTMHKVPKISLNGVDYFPVENETKTVHEEEEEGKYYD